MSRWALITGPKTSDKSGRALRLAGELERAGVRVGGFVQVKRLDVDGRKHYDLVELRSGERTPLGYAAAAPSEEGDTTFCSVTFREDVFAQARRWLERDAADAEALFVGDLSKVEVGGGGHFEAASKALRLPGEKLVVICVRGDQLFYIIEKLGLDDDAVASLELPADDATSRSFYSKILKEFTNDTKKFPAH